jgi:hypothetical protein
LSALKPCGVLVGRDFEANCSVSAVLTKKTDCNVERPHSQCIAKAGRKPSRATKYKQVSFHANLLSRCRQPDQCDGLCYSSNFRAARRAVLETERCVICTLTIEWIVCVVRDVYDFRIMLGCVVSQGASIDNGHMLCRDGAYSSLRCPA